MSQRYTITGKSVNYSTKEEGWLYKTTIGNMTNGVATASIFVVKLAIRVATTPTRVTGSIEMKVVHSNQTSKSKVAEHADIGSPPQWSGTGPNYLSGVPMDPRRMIDEDQARNRIQV